MKKKNSSSRGFTLVEVLFTMTILVLVVGIGLSAIVFIAKSGYQVTKYANLSYDFRHVYEVFSRDARNATDVVTFSSDEVTFALRDGTSVSYTYHPDTDELIRANSTSTEIVLRKLVAFNFDFFDIDGFTASNVDDIALVQYHSEVDDSLGENSVKQKLLSSRFYLRSK